MIFNRRTITKLLDLVNLQRHNDNYADIQTDLTNHEGRITGAQSDITTHKASTAAHPAEHVTYEGEVIGAENIKEGLDIIKTELDQAIISGDSGPEAAASRYNPFTGVTHATLPDRLNGEWEQTATQLAENAINPDRYTGTDLQKLQSAINDAIAQRRAINLWRLFDITGGTLKLGQTLRIPLVITGINKGGIKKTDSGFVFDSDLPMVSDFFFNDVYFESVRLAGTRIFNADKIIVVNLTGCMLRNVDTFIYCSDAAYIQSYRLMACQCVSGNGALFDFVGAYDFSISNCYFEAHENIIDHRILVTGSNPNTKLYNVRIIDSLFQGNVGRSMSLNDCESLKISGCYFEGEMLGNITFKPTAILKSVKIEDCRHGGSTLRAIIKWPANVGVGVITMSNVGQQVPVHDCSLVTAGTILSIKDSASFVDTAVNGHIHYMRENQYIQDGAAIIGLDWGNMRKLYMENASLSMTAGQNQTITVQFLENIAKDDTITPILFPGNSTHPLFTVHYWWRDYTDKAKVYVNVTNNNATTESMILGVTVLKLLPSIKG